MLHSLSHDWVHEVYRKVYRVSRSRSNIGNISRRTCQQDTGLHPRESGSLRPRTPARSSPAWWDCQEQSNRQIRLLTVCSQLRDSSLSALDSLLVLRSTMTFPSVQAPWSWRPTLQMMAHHCGQLTVLSEWGTIGCLGCEWGDRTAIAGTGDGTCNCSKVISIRRQLLPWPFVDPPLRQCVKRFIRCFGDDSHLVAPDVVDQTATLDDGLRTDEDKVNPIHHIRDCGIEH